MADFVMPSLGADMDSGVLVEWRVKPGDAVKRGQVIAEVETAKGVIEIECFDDGVVDQLLVQPSRQQIAVGTAIALIRAPGEAPAAAPAKAAAVAVVTAPVPQAVTVAAPVAAPPAPPPVAPAEPLRVSPLARKVAADLGVDLATVKGTGPHGAIERADVERAAEAKKVAAAAPAPVAAAPAPAAPAPAAPAPAAPAPAAPAAPPVSGKPDFALSMRRAIAAAMAKSNREIPHYYLQTTIDMTKPLKWLEAENLKRPIKNRLLPVIILLKAVARTLQDVPQLNGFWVDDQLQVSEAINICTAIALRQGGLITPCIHGVDLKSMDEMMEAMNDLIMRTRTGHLKGSELSDGTITVTSLGDMGVETVYGVIYPPQVALVGFGKVVERPWAENGMVGARQVITATLAADHRATDGRTGGQFLDALQHHLQEVEKL